MLSQLLLKVLRKRPQFSVRGAIAKTGRAARIFALICLDIGLLFIALRGVGIDGPAPWTYLLNAALIYGFARLLIRVGTQDTAKEKKGGSGDAAAATS